jgi:ankyrin repeat protein
MAAAGAGHDDFVTLLLEQPDIDIDARGGKELYFRTALIYATSVEAVSIVELLLDEGADPNIADSLGETPLLMSITRPDMASLLINHGADVNVRNGVGNTPLILAINSHDIATVDLLLASPDIDVDLPDVDGRTPLMTAASRLNRSGETVFVQTILAAGADPFMTSVDGRTALGYVGDNYAKADLIKDAMAKWEQTSVEARRTVNKKFMVAERLRSNLPQKQLPEYIIRRSEYDNLCLGLHSNLNKPGVVALAKSLSLPTTNQTKLQLCKAIAAKLTL